MIAITDHGPALYGAPKEWYFWNMKVLPGEIYGVRILKGIEANIVNCSGEIDISAEYLKNLDFVIASLHDFCIEPFNVKENTDALVNVLKNPYVDAIAHPGNPKYQVDIERVVKAAKENNKLIEINNQSFYIRTGSESNCRNFVLNCRRLGVRLVCGSDAHISFDVGRFDKLYELLEDAEMPEELVLSASVEMFDEYLKERQLRIES